MCAYSASNVSSDFCTRTLDAMPCPLPGRTVGVFAESRFQVGLHAQKNPLRLGPCFMVAVRMAESQRKEFDNEF